MSIIHIDFQRRAKIEVDETEFREKRREELPDMFDHYDHMIECLEARYGDHQPKGGVVYTSKPSARGFDTYGCGNVHNSVHQWRPKDERDFNRPMPFPADLRAIDTLLAKSQGKTIRLGVKSDPFMWMDCKYSITKSVLQLANKYGVTLEMHTMSDLCGHQDYATLIADGGHKIVMHMGFEHMKFQDDAALEKMLSPGAPSRKRRETAIVKLRELGVDVTTEYSDLRKMLRSKDLLQLICRRTGTGSEYWTGGNAIKGNAYFDFAKRF